MGRFPTIYVGNRPIDPLYIETTPKRLWEAITDDETTPGSLRYSDAGSGQPA